MNLQDRSRETRAQIHRKEGTMQWKKYSGAVSEKGC